MKLFSGKFRKKRLVVMLLSFCVIGFVIGTVIAYSHDRTVMNSVFELAGYHTIYTETYDAPTNWNTCETAPKNITVSNTIDSSGDIAVRVKMEEQWIASDGVTELPLVSATSGKKMAQINLTSNSGWTKQGNYYYYDADLAKNATTSSLISGVTLNCDANIDTSSNAAANADGQYANATYRLKIIAQSIKADLKDDWDKDLAEIIAKQENNLGSYQIEFNASAKKSNSVSEANGNGVNKYTEKGKDIYYFRGEIDNNNIIWANKCWKAMRTTYTGGVKMIYNGEPSEVVVDGRTTQQCNATGTAAHITYNGEQDFAFNSSSNSPAYVGYSYGTAFEFENGACSLQGCIYGNDVEYDSTTGMYTLKDLYTIPSGGWSNGYSRIASDHHYTCKSTTLTTCSAVYYAVNISDTSYNGFIKLSNIENIDAAVSEMFSNTNDSNIKTVVESWFSDNNLDGHVVGTRNYEDDLEDAIFCNDRRMHSGSLKGKDYPTYERGHFYRIGTYFEADDRLVDKDYSSFVEAFRPTLDCDRNDSFTKDDVVNGNSVLSYKVGLATADEFTLAGLNTNEGSYNNYLNTGYRQWLMTPMMRADVADTSGYLLSKLSVSSTGGVRPVVSLKSSMEVASGSGLKTDPYIIE